jgi:hypothetical protein
MNGRHSQLAAVFALTTLLLGATSCGDLIRQGKSPSYLVIDNLTGASGANSALFSGTLQSDVVTLVDAPGAGPTDPKIRTFFEDLGHVTFRIQLKDVGAPGAETTPSEVNAITVNRYHVSYRRADGRNVQGVDVPYAFDGAITATVFTSPVEVTFVLVRLQAKFERPLLPLAGLGSSIAIATIADVTFYGTDQAGNAVSREGSISVNFADWADPE